MGYRDHYLEAVVDPGFPRGGGDNPPGGGANIRFCQIFPKLHEIEIIWIQGARVQNFAM